MTKKQRKVVCLYDTDGLVRNTWLNLARDFRTSEGSTFCRNAETAFLTGVSNFRDYKFPELGMIPVGRFKRYKQMQSLFSKYRFAVDAFSDEALNEKTLQKYFGEQERLATYAPMAPLGVMVVQEARAIARSILGSYEPEQAVLSCKFGKKSSIGCKLSLAYIDEKLTSVKAFTGSSECSRWFWTKVLPEDQILTELVEELGLKPGAPQLMHESLTLINVPKSWKTYRTITPLTLLSLFYSNGLGKLVTERLQAAGLDISRLQNRHRALVKGLSVSCTHATADLSAASDSITMELLNRILPREWYRATKKVTTHQILYWTNGKQRSAYTESVLPMGNGLTFPMETLVFYCLTRAIGNLAGVKGIYSVYGDDLIYPSRLHRFVSRIFPLMKLQLNLDKTFVKYPFRESCGADFYRGCDVRPFHFQGERQKLTPSKYQAFLYKTINGLMRRWDPMEIRQTLVYLYTELALVSTEIHRVPPEYPDTAGVKVSDPRHVPLGLLNLPWSPIYLSHEGHGNYKWKFTYLREMPGHRFVKSVKPYYWLALQGLTDTDENGYSPSHRDIPHEQRRSSLEWVKRTRYRKYVVNGKQRSKRIVFYSPCTVSRTMEGCQIKAGFTHEWI